MKIIVFDTETSGLKPGQIGQISCFVLDTETNKCFTYNRYFKMCYINPDAAKATNRDLDFYEKASDGVEISVYINEIQQLFDNSCIVGHNVDFDENFLKAELEREGLSVNIISKFDTCKYFKDVFKIPYKNGKYKLVKLELCIEKLGLDKEKINLYAQKMFNCNDSTFHDSVYDVTCTYILFNIANDFNKGNVNSEWIKAFK